MVLAGGWLAGLWYGTQHPDWPVVVRVWIERRM